MTVAAMSACFFAVPVHADENPNIPLEDQEEICNYFVTQHAYDVTGINLNNVDNWGSGAYKSGFTYDTTPSENSVALFSGHVAWVDSVNGDQMYIEEGGYYEPSEGRKILHQGWIPSTIGSHEYPSNPDSPVLKGFLHLNIPRKEVPAGIDIMTDYEKITNTTFYFTSEFYDDRIHGTTPYDAGILIGTSADAVQNATVNSHPNVDLANHGNPTALAAYWQQEDQNNIDFGRTYYSQRFYLHFNNKGETGKDMINYPSALQPKTHYYYRTYVQTTAGAVVYSDMETFRTTSDDESIMYRLYNPNTGEHFYTSGTEERDIDVRAGWTYEGVGWIAPNAGTAVMRLYNPVAGEHHYTTSREEADNLVAAGWNLESDCAWYSASASTGVPVYRQYNPNAYACNHNYTSSKDENDWLVSLGWNAEGIAWYAAE